MVCVGPRVLRRPVEMRVLDPQDGSTDTTTVLLLRRGAGILLQLSLRLLQDVDMVLLEVCPKTDIPWPEAAFDRLSLPHCPDTHFHLAHSYHSLLSFLPLPGCSPHPPAIPRQRDTPCPAMAPWLPRPRTEGPSLSGYHLSAPLHVTPDHIPSLYRSHSCPASLGFPQHSIHISHSTQHSPHTDRSGSLCPQILQLLPTSSELKPKDWHGPHPLLF